MRFACVLLVMAGTWTIALLAGNAVAGAVDGTGGAARFREPTGLYFDATARVLYVADTGNHVIRAIDLASTMTTTIAGTSQTLGFAGDGGAATSALLYQPQAIAGCPNGDLFIADTGNNRIRRIAATAHTITTVLGDGSSASSGEGVPSSLFPINAPLGITCDALGNVYATSTNTVRQLAADDTGTTAGTGSVRTIYGTLPRVTFPASVTMCLTGVAVVDTTIVHVTDACTGILVELHRQ